MSVSRMAVVIMLVGWAVAPARPEAGPSSTQPSESDMNPFFTESTKD